MFYPFLTLIKSGFDYYFKCYLFNNGEGQWPVIHYIYYQEVMNH